LSPHQPERLTGGKTDSKRPRLPGGHLRRHVYRSPQSHDMAQTAKGPPGPGARSPIPARTSARTSVRTSAIKPGSTKPSLLGRGHCSISTSQTKLPTPSQPCHRLCPRDPPQQCLPPKERASVRFSPDVHRVTSLASDGSSGPTRTRPQSRTCRATWTNLSYASTDDGRRAGGGSATGCSPSPTIRFATVSSSLTRGRRRSRHR